MGIRLMTKLELREKIHAKIDELPTLPVVLTKLLAVIEEPETNVAKMVEIIEKDPALTGKILKVANSAYYGFSQQIASLDRAVALLGMNMVKSLALSIGVVRNLPKGRDSKLLTHQGLWLHSVAVASAGKSLCEKIGLSKGDDHIFVAGLLHDVGKMVMLFFIQDRYLKALARANDTVEPAPLYLAERDLLGFDHVEVAEMLLTRWKFPPQVIQPIITHHAKDETQELGNPDMALLRLANALPQRIGLGGDGNTALTAPSREDLGLLGLKETDVGLLEKDLAKDQERVLTFFQAMM